MSKRASGYPPVANEFFPTPDWVTLALLYAVKLREPVWEPAAGDGRMLRVVRSQGLRAIGTDAVDHGANLPVFDFLSEDPPPSAVWTRAPRAIVTNPPFGRRGKKAEAFIQCALERTRAVEGQVAMLLPVDFDSAQTRRHLFGGCRAWSLKLVLTRRITWFEKPLGEKRMGPSDNHAWFVWDWRHSGPAQIEYGP